MSDSVVSKSADALPVPSRNFYERATFKVFLSILYFGWALFYLGLCSSNGGESRSYYYTTQINGITSDIKDGYNAMVTGYGFAAFFHFVAFAIMVGACFHISPLTCGSPKERVTLKTPLDLDRSA